VEHSNVLVERARDGTVFADYDHALSAIEDLRCADVRLGTLELNTHASHGVVDAWLDSADGCGKRALYSKRCTSVSGRGWGEHAERIETTTTCTPVLATIETLE